MSLKKAVYACKGNIVGANGKAVFTVGDGGITPTGKITITENGTGIDIAQYAEADVAVPQGIIPTGTVNITENGDTDGTNYATAHVAVPQPTGKITITENGTDIDVSSYATADVSVSGGTERGVAIPSNNKLVLPDGKWKFASNVQTKPTLTIINNLMIIDGTISGASNTYTYFKLTPPFDIWVGATGGDTNWKNETWNGIEVGKTYAMDTFFEGGTKTGSSDNIVSSVKGSDDSTVLAHSQGVKVLADGAAYTRLYLGRGYTFNKYKIGVYIKENEMPTAWEYLNIDTSKKYYSKVVNDNTQFVSILPGRTPNYTQGMCIDDDYIYTCSINGTDADNTFVAKYNKDTGALVTSVTSYSLGHCNSMTIKDGVIYCVALDNAGTIHRINASDLSYIDSVTVDLTPIYVNYTGIGAIFYDEEKEEFVALLRGNTKGYAFFDKNLVFSHILWTENITGTYGSFTVKNGFIYQNIHGSSAEKTAIITRNGTYIDDISLNITSGAEVEDIKFDEWNNYVYINYIVSNNSYVARLVATEMKMVTTS